MSQTEPSEIGMDLLMLPAVPKAKHFRREQRRDGGYNMVPAYTEEEVRSYGMTCVSAFKERQASRAKDASAFVQPTIECMQEAAASASSAGFVYGTRDWANHFYEYLKKSTQE